MTKKILMMVFSYLWLIIGVNFTTWLVFFILSHGNRFLGGNEVINSEWNWITTNWVNQISLFFMDRITYFHGVPINGWLILLIIGGILFNKITYYRESKSFDFNTELEGEMLLIFPLGIIAMSMFFAFFIWVFQLFLFMVFGLVIIIWNFFKSPHETPLPHPSDPHRLHHTTPNHTSILLISKTLPIGWYW